MKKRRAVLICDYPVNVVPGTGRTSLGKKPDGIEPKERHAEGLVTYVTVADPYTKWRTLPGKEERFRGTAPHGPLAGIYLNQAAAASLDQGNKMARESIIVIGSYAEDGRLLGSAVMSKVPGFDPSNGGWYWFLFSPNGKIEARGKVEACVDCHRAAKDRDYIIER